jgi:hypothetical protein
MYGPPPEYPRATSSPTIILLVSGLAALLGFLLGLFVGFGAGAVPGEPTPRVTVTVEDSAPAEPGATETGQSPPAQNTPPQSSAAPTAPSQNTPPQNTPPQNTPPQGTQPAPGQTRLPGGGTSTGPAANPAANSAVNPASLRTFLVGTDIQPGTYRTAGPVGGFSMCYWARLKSTSGDQIATGMPTGAATITIEATDKAFVTGGCAEWTKA